MLSGFPDVTFAAVDERGCVAGDAACTGCGYDLRGVVIGHGCPECGRGIRARPTGQRLSEAGPAYLKKLRWGAGVFLAGTAMGLLGGLPGLALACVGLWGWTAHPGYEERSAERTNRLGARWATTIGTAGLVVTAITAWFTGQRLLRFANGYDLALLLGGLMAAAGLMLGWRHMHTLASRAEDYPAAVWARRAWWSWGVAIVIVGGLSLIANAAELMGVHLGDRLVFALPGGLVFIMAVMLVWLWWRTLRTAWVLWRAVKGERRKDES